MKIALTAKECRADSPMDQRFGRSPCFAFADTETGVLEFADNPNAAAGSGAGIGSAEFLSRRGVQAVVTGDVGPKASRALAAAGITAYLAGADTVEENLAAFTRGELDPL